MVKLDSETFAGHVEFDIATPTLVKQGNWGDYAGKVENLGMVSADDPSANYVQLPASTQFGDGFTEADYSELVAKLANGEITVSNDTEPAEPPAENVTVNFLGNLK